MYLLSQAKSAYIYMALGESGPMLISSLMFLFLDSTQAVLFHLEQGQKNLKLYVFKKKNLLLALCADPQFTASETS